MRDNPMTARCAKCAADEAEKMSEAVKWAEWVLDEESEGNYVAHVYDIARALLASRKEVERLRGDLQLAKEQARDASHVLVSTRAQLDASRREVEELKASIAAEGPKRELNQFRELIGKLSACRAQLREAERQRDALVDPRIEFRYRHLDYDWECRVFDEDYRMAAKYYGATKLDALRAALADAAPPQEEVTKNG